MDSNGSKFHSNASNPFRVVRIRIRMLLISFEWFKFGFECFESFLNASNLNSNSSNPLKWFKFGFKCFESFLNGSNLHSNAFNLFEFEFECFVSLSSGSNLDSNASNPFAVLRICIRML